MSDGVKLPPRPPPSTTTQAPRTAKQEATKNTKMAKKKEADPQATANLSADSFSGAISGSSNIAARLLPGVTANVTFTTTGDPVVVGEIRQGGQLVVKYEPLRARFHDGEAGTWGVTGTVTFEPGGERQDRPMMEFDVRQGKKGLPRAAALTVKVPVTATTVLMRFKNWSTTENWLDDNGGTGFRLGVQPPLKQPNPER